MSRSQVVDAPPEMCRQRAADAPSQPGASDGDGVAGQEQKLSELREIALLLAADVVDQQLEAYLERQGIEQLWGTLERILVFVTPDVDARGMIASGRRNADRSGRRSTPYREPARPRHRRLPGGSGCVAQHGAALAARRAEHR